MTLGTVGSLALAGDEPARQEPRAPDAKDNVDVVTHERLCVTIWPAKTQFSAGEEFEVKLRVVNSSDAPQALKVWSCSWYDHWTWSNRRIGHEPWPCKKNGIVSVELQPGAAYEKSLTMRIEAKGPTKTETLRMGFKPEGEEKTYWSNEVVLSVK